MKLNKLHKPIGLIESCNGANYVVLEEVDVSEGLKYHLVNDLPIHESIYRPYSDKYFELIKEAKQLHEAGSIKFPADSWLEEEHVGQFGVYEGYEVPLDLPIPESWEHVLFEKKSKSKKSKKKKSDKENKPLNKPMKNSGSGKKYKVYVKSPKTGNVIKVTFGDKKGGLKANWNDPKARADFARRHNCAEKKDKTKAGYWACRAHKYFGKNVPGRFW